MTEPSMAEVLAEHRRIEVRSRTRRGGGIEHSRACICDEPLPWIIADAEEAHLAHVAQALAAAGFGHVASVVAPDGVDSHPCIRVEAYLDATARAEAAERERDFAIRTANISADFRVAAAEAQGRTGPDDEQLREKFENKVTLVSPMALMPKAAERFGSAPAHQAELIEMVWEDLYDNAFDADMDLRGSTITFYVSDDGLSVTGTVKKR